MFSALTQYFYTRKTCADSSCSIVANHFSKKIKRRCTHRFRVLVTRLVAPNNHHHPHKRAYTSANYMTRIYSFFSVVTVFFLFCVPSSGCYCLTDCLLLSLDCWFIQTPLLATLNKRRDEWPNSWCIHQTICIHSYIILNSRKKETCH